AERNISEALIVVVLTEDKLATCAILQQMIALTGFEGAEFFSWRCFRTQVEAALDVAKKRCLEANRRGLAWPPKSIGQPDYGIVFITQARCGTREEVYARKVAAIIEAVCIKGLMARIDVDLSGSIGGDNLSGPRRMFIVPATNGRLTGARRFHP